MTAHPGSFCAPAGAVDQTNAGTDMVCSVGDKPGRARWRRNGPAPARTTRRRGRASKTTGGALPQVDAGINPTAAQHAVPEAADAQAQQVNWRITPHDSDRTGPDATCTRCRLPAANGIHTNSARHQDWLDHEALVNRAGGPIRPDESMEDYDARLAPFRDNDDPAKQPMTDDEIADKIRQAYGKALAEKDPGSNRYVMLKDVRNNLDPSIDRADADRVLDKMIEDPKVHLQSELNQAALDDDDRAAAVKIGGQDRDVMSIGDPYLADATKTGKPMTDDEIADKMRQAYGDEPGQWMSLKDIANKTGLTPEDIARGTSHLMHSDDGFAAEPEPFGHRIQAEDKAVAPIIGGEPRHKVRFGLRDEAPLTGAHATTANPTPTATPTPTPPASTAPAGRQDAAVAKPGPVDGRHTARAPKPNDWGSLPNANSHTVHFDGPLPRAVELLGQDARIDMGGGEPLADTILDLGDQVRAGRLHPAELPERLAAVRDRLPKDSSAYRAVSQMAAEVDAPMTDVPHLPEGTPEPLRRLVGELHRIPICRQRPERELGRVAELAKRLAAGEIRARDVERQIGYISRHEANSDTGSIQINRMIRETVQQLEDNRREASRQQRHA